MLSLVRVTEMMGGICEGLEMCSRARASGVTKERQLGMRNSAREVRLDEDSMWAALDDGRMLGIPLTWLPRLMAARPAEREAVEIGAFGLRWEALDVDVSVEGLLAGRGDRTARGPEAA